MIFPDENPGTSGVRSPEEHSNDSRTTLCRSGLSGAVRVSSEGTRFLTIGGVRPRLCHNPCRTVPLGGICQVVSARIRWSATSCMGLAPQRSKGRRRDMIGQAGFLCHFLANAIMTVVSHDEKPLSSDSFTPLPRDVRGKTCKIRPTLCANQCLPSGVKAPRVPTAVQKLR